MSKLDLRKFISILFLFMLTTSVSCVLKKRDQPKKDDSKQSDSNSSPSFPTIKNVPIKNIPGHLDRQGQIDLDAFYNPADVDPWEQQEQSKEPLRWKALTGHKLDLNNGKGNDLAYSDSSTDLLVNKIRVLNNERGLSKEQKQRYSDFAKDIKSVKILDSRGTIFSVLIQYEIGSYKVWNPQVNWYETKKDKVSVQTKRLSGNSKEDGRYALMSELSSDTPETADDQSSSDLMKGELRCLDLLYKSRCSNYLLHIVLTKSGGIDFQADIILRSATATISEVASIKPNKDKSLSEKSTKLLDIFNKTYDDHYFEDKHIKMHSIAVVDGLSEFKLELHTNKGESISIGGPLLTGLGNSLPLNYPLSKNPDYKIFQEKPNHTTDISNLFDVAMLNFNNGRGKIKIVFQNATTVSSSAAPTSTTTNTSSTSTTSASTSNNDSSKQQLEEITVTVSNQTVPIIPLTKEAIFFSPSLSSQ